LVVGDFKGEGRQLMSLTWGKISLIDVYVGFALFCGWIFFREKSLLRSVLWTIATAILGNFTTSLYVLLALRESRGDWNRFWLGQRSAQT
jgi:hypothetical protein